MADIIYLDPNDTNASIIKVDGKCYERGEPSEKPPQQYTFDSSDCNECPECCGPFCYRVTGYSSSGDDCCYSSNGCCNYGDGPIDELLAGGPPTWAAFGRGPSGTSDWTLVRGGTGPTYMWTLTNDCEVGCHPGAYTGTAQWDGQGSKVFQMGSYPPLTVTKVSCS